MTQTIILTGDVNLMNVTDPTTPFRLVQKEFHAADVVFSNLECCLYEPPKVHDDVSEGFFVEPGVAGQSLKYAGIHGVGLANNVNYGSEPILTSIGHLDSLGIAHTGAGKDRASACAPALIERNGLSVGVLQRCSVYWPTNHEAGPHTPGIAAFRGHTAYQVPMHRARPEIPPMNRPGIPPSIITWADPAYLKAFAADIQALRPKVDLLIASCHWGLAKEVLEYMTEMAHAAIDAGADVVFGHGPHYSLPVEIYKGKPIFYGLGSFSFHTGHRDRKHGDWIGMMAKISVDGKKVTDARFRFVRHNQNNETVLCPLSAEARDLAEITQSSAALGAILRADGDEVVVSLNS
jgi:poly-gamma-glutamate capsule biosynthesis protein CapA/YwtB (metallophosphatase superfamily)